MNIINICIRGFLIFILSSITSISLANPTHSSKQQYGNATVLPMNEIIVQFAVYFSRNNYSLTCNATNWFKTTCDHSTYCEAIETNYLCGDPDPSNGKAGFVKYTCGSRTKVASATQGAKMILDCSIE